VRYRTSTVEPTFTFPSRSVDGFNVKLMSEPDDERLMTSFVASIDLTTPLVACIAWLLLAVVEAAAFGRDMSALGNASPVAGRLASAATTIAAVRRFLITVSCECDDATVICNHFTGTI